MIDMVSYYDFVLVFVPVSLVGVPGLLSAIGFDLTLAIPLGAALAAALIGHAMFVRAPTGHVRHPSAAVETGFAPQVD